ncbi:hypothetical protein J2857_005314 [Neorhizobium galegae]|uniref:hypothetical protein n=1 Tax=Neorhizobium galegae TaxID=399 RepID=UPI001AE5AFAB|nr:hypothetical protein [Neorhizobium galegae]MBP2562523.1 hypothetical protein [Neorhizobium galegae]
MIKRPITAAMRLHVELALAAARRDSALLDKLKAEATKISLTGAEIDAAERGGSFDVIIDSAVKFVLAESKKNELAITHAETKLATLGLPLLADHLRSLLDELRTAPRKHDLR